jgi:ABC-type phosphate transport system substrate-binding protein
MKKRLEGFWFKLLFSLAFAGIGVGLFVFDVLPSLYDWHQMKNWQEVSAQLQDVNLVTNPGDDSDTYEATARYSYRFEGRDYTSTRVAIVEGSDNIGNFQQHLAAQLKSALRNQQSVPA